MAENKASKKTKRSARTPKRGAVRNHVKKQPERQTDTGLIEEMRQRRASQSGGQRPFLKDAPRAAALVATTVGFAMVEEIKPASATPLYRRMVRDYIKSLTEGDGSQPADLPVEGARQVGRIFVSACFEHRVAWDVLPGQRTDWYRQQTAKVRYKATGGRPPSPKLDMPAAKADTKELLSV